MQARVTGLDHVQVAMPPGEEERARAFYTGVLRMREIPKPEILAGRGGAWFAAGAAQVHLGVERDFRPARKAHPALVVDGLAALAAACEAAGHPAEPGEQLDGRERVYVHDPFGNRIELIERAMMPDD